MIVGRKKEKSLLSNVLRSKNAEFMAVYGRRRIGKTFLLEDFFSEQDCHFFHVTGIQKGKLKDQLSEFSKEIGRCFYGGVGIEIPVSWMQAFEQLSSAMNFLKDGKPVVLFMDEFPWVATPKSYLLQALEYYWNRFWKNDKRIKLILCGSSAAWIIKKIIHHKGGLHNRLTQKLRLKPFDLHETKAFLEHKKIKLNNKQLLELYFAVGGVPYYLQALQKGGSLTENINQLCFQQEGLLFDEFDKVFASLFKEAEAYEELVRVMAKSRNGISREQLEKEIKLTQKGGTLTARLKDLAMAGFIKEFLPINHARKGLYYRVADEYSFFYLRWIEPELKNIELEIEDNNFWFTASKTPAYRSWCGYAFESFCYKHVAQIKKALGIKVASKIGSWRFVPTSGSADNGAQIDLLFDRQDDAVTLCEIKFSQEPFVIDKEYAEKLKQKMEVYKRQTKTKKQIFLALITVNGAQENKYFYQLIDNVVVFKDFLN